MPYTLPTTRKATDQEGHLQSNSPRYCSAGAVIDIRHICFNYRKPGHCASRDRAEECHLAECAEEVGNLTLLLEQDDACRGVLRNPKGAGALVFETTLLLLALIVTARVVAKVLKVVMVIVMAMVP